MKANNSPAVAFVGIYNKLNEPVMVRNYLVEYLERAVRTEEYAEISE